MVENVLMLFRAKEYFWKTKIDAMTLALLLASPGCKQYWLCDLEMFLLQMWQIYIFGTATGNSI